MSSPGQDVCGPVGAVVTPTTPPTVRGLIKDWWRWAPAGPRTFCPHGLVGFGILDG